MIKLLLSRANNKELSGVATTVVDVVEKSAYKDDKLTNLNMTLKKEGDDLSTAQNRKRKNDLTEVVDELETGRKNAFKAFSFTTKGLTFRNDETLKSNAKLVYEVIKRHGLRLYSLPGMERTAQLKSLRAELSKPEYVAAMSVTGLTAAFEEMNLQDQKFQEGSANRTDNERKKAEEIPVILSEAGKKTKTYLDTLIGYLNSSIVADNSVELKQLCDNLAIIIDKANANVHARITRVKNGNAENEQDKLDEELENGS